MKKILNVWSEQKHVLILLGIAVLSFLFSHIYSNELCNSAGNCTSTERYGLWIPIKVFSFSASLLLLPFLFLPIRYFKSWVLKILSWFLPITMVLVLSESPHGGSVLQIGRDGMVKLMAVVLANLTLVFALYEYAKDHVRWSKIAGFWYLLLLGVTLFVSTQLLHFFF
jgi:hypothetical protein